MPWRVDDSAQRDRFDKGKHVPVPGAAMRKYYDWKRLIEDRALDPKTAAGAIGDMHYEQLKGKKPPAIHTIRLSQEHRVVFTVDNGTQVVNVLQVGGHYP